MTGLPSGHGLRWSVSLRDAATGAVLHEDGADVLLPTASVGKVFALIDLAARATAGELDLAEVADRRDSPRAADSGTWQHLRAARLALADVAALVGQTSDNWATNVLLDRLGLDSVRAQAATLVDGGSTLHDYVRDVRRPADPPTLSSGCADDWTSLLTRVARGTCVNEGTSALVRGWLRLGTDLSMVASAFGLDPLSHVEADLGTTLFHKTGTDVGVRADVGVLGANSIGRGHREIAYACLCVWEDDGSREVRELVLRTMRGLGAQVLRTATAPPA